jgi:hypothetical protein
MVSRKSFLLLLTVTILPAFYAEAFPCFNSPGRLQNNVADTFPDRQALFNGRLWRDLYVSIKEDQFLFSDELLNGSVTINGRKFNNLKLRYDIYNDEIILLTDRGILIQVNKEMVDNFTLVFQGKIHNFINVSADSIDLPKGYIEILHEGITALYVKYKKEIDRMAVDNKYDIFYQVHRIYLKKDEIVSTVVSNRAFKKFLDDNKQKIRNFIKANNIRISRQIPESFVTVLEFYDSLRR